MNGTADDATLTISRVVEAAWPIPLWVCIVYVIATITFSFWVYRQERGHAGRWSRSGLVVLRSALFAMVLWMLAGWVRHQYKTQPPELVLVIDRSGSMATTDIDTADIGRSGAAPSRLEWAIDQILTLPDHRRQELQRHYLVRGFTVAETVEIVAGPLEESDLQQITPRGKQSRLGEGLVQVVQQQAGRGTAAIVFFSDGINTAGRSLADAARAARRAAVPVYAVLAGRAAAVPDLAVAEVMHDQDVFLGDRVIVEAMVTARNVKPTNLQVRLVDGDSEQTLDRAEVPIAAGQSQAQVRLAFTPEVPGEHSIRVEVEALHDESDIRNNLRDTSIRVQDRTISVMLVADQPSYEFRFLKNLLERVRGTGPEAARVFQLQCVLQRADPGYVDQDATAIRLVPADAESIARIDVFIFIDADPTLISRRSQELIYDAVVNSGAGCIFVSSDARFWKQLRAWPLGELLPVADAATDEDTTYELFRWKPTPLGMSAMPLQLESSDSESLAIWRTLPQLQVRSPLGLLGPAAQVLATTDVTEDPVLVSQFAGAGRVVLQATDETFRWATFLGSDLYYQRYWGQILRWLARGKLSPESRASQLVVQPSLAAFGQPVRVEVHLGKEIAQSELPTQVEVALSGPQERKLLLDRPQEGDRIYVATINDLVPGTYRVMVVRPAVIAALKQTLEVAAPPGETANLQPDVAAMQQLAETTRGRFYTPADADRLWDELPAGRPARVGTLPPRPLWNHPLVVVLFIMLITTEWLWRRRLRML